jgi:hypothetical protein
MKKLDDAQEKKIIFSMGLLKSDINALRNMKIKSADGVVENLEMFFNQMEEIFMDAPKPNKPRSRRKPETNKAGEKVNFSEVDEPTATH